MLTMVVRVRIETEGKASATSIETWIAVTVDTLLQGFSNK